MKDRGATGGFQPPPPRADHDARELVAPPAGKPRSWFIIPVGPSRWTGSGKSVPLGPAPPRGSPFACDRFR
jgi:hypothetical protein